MLVGCIDVDEYDVQHDSLGGCGRDTLTLVAAKHTVVAPIDLATCRTMEMVSLPTCRILSPSLY